MLHGPALRERPGIIPQGGYPHTTDVLGHGLHQRTHTLQYWILGAELPSFPAAVQPAGSGCLSATSLMSLIMSSYVINDYQRIRISAHARRGHHKNVGPRPV